MCRYAEGRAVVSGGAPICGGRKDEGRRTRIKVRGRKLVGIPLMLGHWGSQTLGKYDVRKYDVGEVRRRSLAWRS